MKVIDLFSGCGGMSLGFQNSGHDIIAAFDNWKPAIEVYKDNFSHPIIECDLGSEEVLDQLKDYKPKMIIGGPPCQDFSTAGHRDESLGRASLTKFFSKIVINVKPTYFVFENVSRFSKSPICDEIKSLFKTSGYSQTERILDASYYGVPQRRKRYFLIGHLNGKDGFLNPYLDNNSSISPMSIHIYLGDSLGVEYYFRIPRSYKRRAIFSIHEPCVTIRGVDRPIPKTYKKHPGDLVEIGDKVRALTVEERSYIQTFPKNFKFKGTKSDLNLMIGNAVPVNLAKVIGDSISEYEADLVGV